MVVKSDSTRFADSAQSETSQHAPCGVETLGFLTLEASWLASEQINENTKRLGQHFHIMVSLCEKKQNPTTKKTCTAAKS